MTSPATLLTPGFQSQLSAGGSGAGQPAESAQAQGVPVFPDLLLFAVEGMADPAAPQPDAFGFGLPGTHSTEQLAGELSAGEVGELEAVFADQADANDADAPAAYGAAAVLIWPKSQEIGQAAPQPGAFGFEQRVNRSAERSPGESRTGEAGELEGPSADEAAAAHADAPVVPGAVAVVGWPQQQTIQSPTLLLAVDAVQPEPDLARQSGALQSTGDVPQPIGPDSPLPSAGSPPELFGPNRAQPDIQYAADAPAGRRSSEASDQSGAKCSPDHGCEQAITAGGNAPAETPDEPGPVKGEHPPAGDGRIAESNPKRSRGASRAGAEDAPVQPEPGSPTVLPEVPVSKIIPPTEGRAGNRRELKKVVEESEFARSSLSPGANAAASAPADVQSGAPSPVPPTTPAPVSPRPAADAASSAETLYGTPGVPLPARAASARPARNSDAELAFEGRVIPGASPSSSPVGAHVRMVPEARVPESQKPSGPAVLPGDTGKPVAVEPEAAWGGDGRRDADERRTPLPDGSPSPAATRSSEVAGKEPAAAAAPPAAAYQAPENRAPASLTVDVAEQRPAFHSAAPARSAGEPVRTERTLEPAPEPASARSPVRDITLKLDGENRVEVRLMERRGEVHFTVRTPDPQLAGDLRRDLPSLTTRFHEAGLRGEAWHPASAASERQDALMPGASAQTPQQQAGEGEQRRRQDQPSEQQRGEGNPRTKDNGKEFSWFLQSMA